MHHEIYANAQYNVEINNIRASDAEIERLKEIVAVGIGANNPPPVVVRDGMDRNGTRYRMNFSIRGPKSFDDQMFVDWLHSVGLVGWCLDAEAGPIQ